MAEELFRIFQEVSHVNAVNKRVIQLKGDRDHETFIHFSPGKNHNALFQRDSRLRERCESIPWDTACADVVISLSGIRIEFSCFCLFDRGSSLFQKVAEVIGILGESHIEFPVRRHDGGQSGDMFKFNDFLILCDSLTHLRYLIQGFQNGKKGHQEKGMTVLFCESVERFRVRLKSDIEKLVFKLAVVAELGKTVPVIQIDFMKRIHFFFFG